jgi:hypothetical protein
MLGLASNEEALAGDISGHVIYSPLDLRRGDGFVLGAGGQESWLSTFKPFGQAGSRTYRRRLPADDAAGRSASPTLHVVVTATPELLPKGLETTEQLPSGKAHFEPAPGPALAATESVARQRRDQDQKT